MKLLNGNELTEFIKERQAQQVRNLRQAYKIFPKLAVICTDSDSAVAAYKAYGEDILTDVDVHKISQNEIGNTITALNSDSSVHGIKIQDVSLESGQKPSGISAEKDVDGLGDQAGFDPAIIVAVNWLLAGYNVDARGKQVLILGSERSLDKLAQIWDDADTEVLVADPSAENLAEATKTADILVCGPNIAELITPDMVKQDAVIVDTGQDSLGSLNVCALFDNVLRSARASAKP